MSCLLLAVELFHDLQGELEGGAGALTRDHLAVHERLAVLPLGPQALFEGWVARSRALPLKAKDERHGFTDSFYLHV